MRFVIDISIKHTDEGEPDPIEVADALLDYLCDGGDGLVEYPPMIDTVDGVDPA